MVVGGDWIWLWEGTKACKSLLLKTMTRPHQANVINTSNAIQRCQILSLEDS
jgi:hypothetical protein